MLLGIHVAGGQERLSGETFESGFEGLEPVSQTDGDGGSELRLADPPTL